MKSSLPARFTRVSAFYFILWLVVAAFILATINHVAPSFEQLSEGGPRMVKLLKRMWPPNLEIRFLNRIGNRLFETFQIALAGASIGIVLSLPLAWLAAKGISPLGRLAFIVKGFISFLRTVPDLVWALILVSVVGLGAVAGTLTIVVDTIGFCGRFFAEAMEDAEEEPQHALAALGANRLSILFSAILPNAFPSIINSSLFSLEKAVRSSVVLGLVGAGGIGQELQVAFDLFQYRNAATIILVIFVLVLAMEYLTERLRVQAQ